MNTEDSESVRSKLKAILDYEYDYQLHKVTTPGWTPWALYISAAALFWALLAQAGAGVIARDAIRVSVLCASIGGSAAIFYSIINHKSLFPSERRLVFGVDAIAASPPQAFLWLMYCLYPLVVVLSGGAGLLVEHQIVIGLVYGFAFVLNAFIFVQSFKDKPDGQIRYPWRQKFLIWYVLLLLLFSLGLFVVSAREVAAVLELLRSSAVSYSSLRAGVLVYALMVIASLSVPNNKENLRLEEISRVRKRLQLAENPGVYEWVVKSYMGDLDPDDLAKGIVHDLESMMGNAERKLESLVEIMSQKSASNQTADACNVEESAATDVYNILKDIAEALPELERKINMYSHHVHSFDERQEYINDCYDRLIEMSIIANECRGMPSP